MKKISFILSAAAMLSAVACQNELFEAQNEPVSGGNVFTCTLEDDPTKTLIDENGTPKWQEGDIIVLYNGANANSANKTNSTTFQVLEDSADGIYFYMMVNSVKEALTNNIIEKIVITPEMISADGKTVTFTKTIDDAASKYYAFAEQKGAHLIYSINSSGTVTLRESKNHTCNSASATRAVHGAVAVCNAGSNTFSFKNIYCQIKFDVTAGKYNKVTFEANSGSTNTFVCGSSSIKFDGSSMGTASNKTDPYTITLGNAGEGPYYVPVASAAVLDKGITIKCYKTATDTEPYVISTKTAFPVARNTIVNLGNLDALKPVTSYYESWQSGDDITINGVKYNKSTYGDATLISENTTWNESAASNGGVFFIADGATLTVSVSRPKNSVIIMSDKPGTRSNLVLEGTFMPQVENLGFIFNSLNISLKKNALLYAARTVTKVGFYSCKMEYVGLSNFSLSANSKIQNVEYAGCDMKISSASIGIFDGKLNVVKINSIVFNDNILYPDTSGRTFFFFRQSRSGITDTVGSVEIKNNTIYDIAFGTNGLCSPKSVDAFYLENNIFAYSATSSSYQRCLWLSTDSGSSATAVDGYPTTGSVKNNISFNASGRVLGIMNPSVNLAGKSWYPTDYKEITNASENPFSTADIATGTFTRKSAFASYGAKR